MTPETEIIISGGDGLFADLMIAMLAVTLIEARMIRAERLREHVDSMLVHLESVPASDNPLAKSVARARERMQAMIAMLDREGLRMAQAAASEAPATHYAPATNPQTSFADQLAAHSDAIIAMIEAAKRRGKLD